MRTLNFNVINNLSDLYFQLFKKTPKNITFSFFIEVKGFIDFRFSTLKSLRNNFYLDNSITRNSKVLSLCATQFKSLKYNFH